MPPTVDTCARPPSFKEPAQEKRDDLTWAPTPIHYPSIKLLPASQFSWEELTEAYNQTRIDYIVPMPMSVARLREYVHKYDVNLAASVAAIEDDRISGLALLGVRDRRTWPTRVGVLPISRQHGLGRLLMEYLIDQSRQLGAAHSLLEVIKGNEPAHRLFKKLGFQETRELLILRRPPGPPAQDAGAIAPYEIQALDYHSAIALLRRYQDTPSWLNEVNSLENAGNISGLQVELDNGGRGWLVYRNTIFQLSHLVLQTKAGDPREVGRALLHALHSRHPAQDTNTENVSAHDPHLPAMWDLNYLESFRRIEMQKEL